jgi:hypothetical protein
MNHNEKLVRGIQFYVLEGKEVRGATMEEWEAWSRTQGDVRVVAKHELGGKRVSTVFLGLEHGFNQNGLPLLFETMVFPRDSYDEEYMERYTTWDEAVEGHWRAVEMVDPFRAAILKANAEA